MPTYTVGFTGRIPSKKNSKRILRVGGRTIVACSKDYSDWQKNHVIDLRKDWGRLPLPRVSSVTLAFTAGDRRAFDLTNKAESIMDLLVDAGVLADDSVKVVPCVMLCFNGVTPGSWYCSASIDY